MKCLLLAIIFAFTSVAYAHNSAAYGRYGHPGYTGKPVYKGYGYKTYRTYPRTYYRHRAGVRVYTNPYYSRRYYSRPYGPSVHFGVVIRR